MLQAWIVWQLVKYYSLWSGRYLWNQTLQNVICRRNLGHNANLPAFLLLYTKVQLDRTASMSHIILSLFFSRFSFWLKTQANLSYSNRGASNFQTHKTQHKLTAVERKVFYEQNQHKRCKNFFLFLAPFFPRKTYNNHILDLLQLQQQLTNRQPKAHRSDQRNQKKEKSYLSVCVSVCLSVYLSVGFPLSPLLGCRFKDQQLYTRIWAGHQILLLCSIIVYCL